MFQRLAGLKQYYFLFLPQIFLPIANILQYNNRHHFQHEDFTQTISSCQRQTRFLSHPHRAFPFLATCRPHVAGAWGPWQGMWPGINSTNEWVGLLVDAVDSGNVLKRMPNVFCHQDHQDKEDKKKARRKHKVPCLNDIRAIRGAGLCKDVRHLVIWQGCFGACFFHVSNEVKRI